MWTDFAAGEGTRERSGDMLKLAALVMFGGDLGSAVKWAISTLGLDDLDPRRLATKRAEAAAKAKTADEDAARKAEKMRRIAMGIWVGGAPIEGTPAELYLASRGIDLALLDEMPRRAALQRRGVERRG